MMSELEVRRFDSILAKFDEELEGGRYHARYDPAGDILTVVFTRPDSPLTTHDRSEGVYIDIDPDDPRITAMTVVNYRSRFLPRHASRASAGPLERVRTRLMLFLDRLGVGAGAYWERYAANARLHEALGNYCDLIRREPERLEGLGPTPASA